MYKTIFYLVGALSAMLHPALADDDAGQQAKSSDAEAYVVGSDPSFAPFEFRDEKGGVTGFDYDILNAVAKAEGFEVTFIPTPWNGMFDKLGKDFDILASGIAITDDRKKKVDFSHPYIETYGVAAVNEANKYVTEFAELAPLKIAAQAGEFNLPFLETLGEDVLAGVDLQNTLYLAFAEVASGRADAMVGNIHAIKHFSKEHNTPMYEVNIPQGTANDLGFAVQKGNKALRDKLNSGLAKIKQNGEYDRIYQQWFGNTQ